MAGNERPRERLVPTGQVSLEERRSIHNLAPTWLRVVIILWLFAGVVFAVVQQNWVWASAVAAMIVCFAIISRREKDAGP